MSDIWYISAELEHVGEHRVIVYKMDDAQEYANPNLGTILLWCRDPCERLLKELQKKKADTKDIEFVKNEILFLKETEDKWTQQQKKQF